MSAPQTPSLPPRAFAEDGANTVSLIDTGEEIRDSLNGLIERVAAYPGAAFAPEVLGRLATLKKKDRAAFELLRSPVQARHRGSSRRMTCHAAILGEELFARDARRVVLVPCADQKTLGLDHHALLVIHEAIRIPMSSPSSCSDGRPRRKKQGPARTYRPRLFSPAASGYCAPALMPNSTSLMA